MLLLAELLGLTALILWVYCLVDIIMSEEGAARNMPKLAWLVIVAVVPLAGSIAWLIAGRPRRTGTSQGDHALPPDRGPRGVPPSPETDAEFRRRIRKRAEEQRRKATGPDPDPPA